VSTTALTTENWIALFAIYTVLFAAILLTLWHRYQENIRQQRDLENAYRQREKDVTERTQSLRAINSELYQEIHQRKQTETKLRQAQEHLNSIIDSMPSIMIGVTSDGLITHWNTQARQLTGCGEEVIGKSLWDIYPGLPVNREMISSAIANRAPFLQESCKQVIEGEIRFQDISVYPLLSPSADSSAEAIIQVNDVTLRVMMEKTMIQNEKMMSLGELAAGVAHEINNPLGAILQHVQNIERRTSSALAQNKIVAEQAGTRMDSIEKYLEARQIKHLLDGIREAGERSARLVANMLDFSHKSQPHSQVKLNILIQHCLELSGNIFHTQQDGKKTPIALATRLDETLPDILCSPAEIQQVVLNLLRNACQCFSDRTPGSTFPDVTPVITISTSRETNYLLLRIADNGPGMPEEIRQHIFEPFFTTKAIGNGTGLGLSISYFIITQHHRGKIDVESTLGVGTCFSVRLPINSRPLLTDLHS
jgi:PAS domain S-box-containing protein